MTRPTPARRRSARLAGAVVLAACALTATACTGPGDAAPPESAATAVSPLGAVLGMGDEDAMAEARNAQSRQVDEAIAACMTEQGFEYAPDTGTGLTVVVEGEPVDTTTRRWAEDNGYGISTVADLHSQTVTMDDPNQAVLAAMTPAEQEAFYTALLGDLASFDGSDAEAAPTLGEMGCTGRAQQEVYGAAGSDLAPDAVEMGFMDLVTELREQIVVDPALADVSAQWAACMDEAGVGGHRTPQAARDEFSRRLGLVEVDPETGMPVDGPELQALQEEERATAVADFDCQEETHFAAAFQKVQFEREQEFIDAHGPEVEAYRAAREALGG